MINPSRHLQASDKRRSDTHANTNVKKKEINEYIYIYRRPHIDELNMVKWRPKEAA